MPALYEKIGAGYSTGRREDPRIADLIFRAMGDCGSVVNAGAGAGSYEPPNTRVVSVEPSLTMMRQRQHPSRLLVQARAERLPFRDGAFDCALAVLTIHHWSPVQEGLAELGRVARRSVILTWDQEVWDRFWLFDYCPGLRRRDRRRAVAISTIAETLGPCEVIPVPIPHDCLDGFQGAFWRRPAAYLDAEVRKRISGFALAPRQSYERGLAHLAADIADDTWQRKHAALMKHESIDLGYRLIIAGRRLV